MSQETNNLLTALDMLVQAVLTDAAPKRIEALIVRYDRAHDVFMKKITRNGLTST